MNWAWRCMALVCLLGQFAIYETGQTGQTGQDAKSWIGRMVFGINQNRINFLTYDGGSNIDTDVRFEKLFDVIEYLPRAIGVGFFAPFPNRWILEGKSLGIKIIHFISAIEMALTYFMLMGLLSLLFFQNTQQTNFMAVFSFSSVVIIILTISIPNVGFLYRMRFAPWQIINGLGCVGWFLWFQSQRSFCSKISILWLRWFF
jgi:hypothetical protein